VSPMTCYRKYDRAVCQDSVAEYRTVRDQSEAMPDIFATGRVDHNRSLPSAKITIVSNAAMHTPRPSWVKSRDYRTATRMAASPQSADITLAIYLRCRRDGLDAMERRRSRRRKGRQSGDLHRSPLATARSRNAALLERRCDGPQRLTTGRL
jgi:hypothetical protein